MKKVNLTIDGHKIKAEEGKTILNVVRENKLADIPTLCHDDRLEPYGSCFLCVVEVNGAAKLFPSCCTPVAEGMNVVTSNERIIKARKTALELLLSNHYADCLSPCKDECPAGVDTQGYMALLANGKEKEALRLIKENNPLPIVCGRICVRFCEVKCRREHIDEPVAINFIKRYIADYDRKDYWKPEIPVPNGKKVAVIGSGPAGLSCAYYLLLKGYKVTIFEMMPETGGMLRYGIPEYRLPKKTLQEEIDWIINLGIDLKKNTKFGEDFDIESLKKEGYDSIFVGIGAQLGRPTRLPGEDEITQVISGIDFLRNLQLDPEKSKVSGTVIISGGGNTAIDAARTALRVGADKVIIMYRRGLREMPAHPAEVEAAQHEGVEIMFLTNPVGLVEENNNLKSVKAIKMELQESKSGGRPRPVPIEGSEFEIKADWLISAIGQEVDTQLLNKVKIPVSKKTWGVETLYENVFSTPVEGVFTGGDAMLGPATVIEGIGHGKKAAEEIDRFLMNKNKPVKEYVRLKTDLGEVLNSEFANEEKIARNVMPELDAEQRTKTFDEVETGFTKEQTYCEASRCLECGCGEYIDCELRNLATEYEIDNNKFLGNYRKFEVDDADEYIVFDANKCINCGRCVRTCKDIMGVSAISFINRGFGAIVKPAMEKPLSETNCISCGNCVDACPTGAISIKRPGQSSGTIPRYNVHTVCNVCSVGCNVNYRVINDKLFYPSNTVNEVIDSHNDGYLCKGGRFSYNQILEDERIIVPEVKNGKDFEETKWNDAIKLVSDKLSEIKNKYGENSIAILVSSLMTNEEFSLVNSLSSKLDTNQIASHQELFSENNLNCLDEKIKKTVSTCCADEINNADTIIEFNTDFPEKNLVMKLKIMKAQKKGAKVITIESDDNIYSKKSDLRIKISSENYGILFKNLLSINADMKEVTEKCCISEDQFSKLLTLVRDKNVVFVTSLDIEKNFSEESLNLITDYLQKNNKLKEKGNGLLILRNCANSVGIKYNFPNMAPKSKILDNLKTGKIKGVMVLSGNPMNDREKETLFDKVEFLVVSDFYHTPATERANVVFPASSALEDNGSFTSFDGSIQTCNMVISKKGMLNREWLYSIIESLHIMK